MQFQHEQEGTKTPSFTQPPAVITTKDYSYLTDMLSWNLLGFKKAHFAANQCTDPDVKKVLEEACHLHEKHYQLLLNRLVPPSQEYCNQ
ncbi:hypothetical protein A374_10008 [Fictibacillus macauensis ZFHKF-1]|uniref:Coat F domain-containing protein n=1 Tax=Fictibacillus macauensis ZFHKF-1 TaxID=1196324 RepID=I8UFH9_9BACL|nr:hypothetical protein [Fictibacillus macauensis]EIT85563.1 hypothetical protein A374_10008 [Fictibacillus macauensis ZFHKF-1]